MFPYITHSDEHSWKPGPYEGVELKVLHEHPETGALTVLRKFAAGVSVPAHTHSKANETAYILSGEWEEDGKVYGPGSVFHAPKGLRHGPHVARSEVVSLTFFDGPLTVE